MCCSLAPAVFTHTRLMMYEALHPVHGEIMVIGYENTAKNLSLGPNAMLLHFPSADPMTQDNFIPTSTFSHILGDMERALTPVSRGFQPMLVGSSRIGMKALVFEHGIYTVVLARSAEDIPEALERVPAHKRPNINPEIFRFYAEHYPEWGCALCCFNNREAGKADPLLVWYRPKNGNVFQAPGIDAHSGRPPRFGELVEVDHFLIAGSYRSINGMPVHYSDDIPEHVRPFLPSHVIGMKVSGQMQNGDFGIERALVSRKRLERAHIQRLLPGQVAA